MVRADDEQQSESTAPQIAAGNPPPTAGTDSSPRLTPMPPWLMHWWTPLLLAGILLAAGSFLASIWRMPLRPVSWWTINPYCPPSWPFNYHWPSKDAMALCATIAGAGFAFSAWQQRSHDNAIREEERTKAQQQFEQDLREREQQRIEKREQYEKEREQREQQIRLEQRRYEADRRHSEQKIRREQRRYEARRAEREQDRLDKQHQFDVEREERERNRLEQIERDEYWKRREQAYSLLSSPNASIRLGAIELLIELVNITTESPKQQTRENQQFIQHITTALCAQVRHEGLNIETEGTQEEHALIQSEIITRLLDIANQSSGNSEANAWHGIRFNLSQTTFYTPVYINGITLRQELDFSNSLFLENLRIEDTRLNSLNWEGTELRSQTIISKSKLRFNTFPSYIKFAHFSKTTFSTRLQSIDSHEIILPFNLQITTDEPIEQILFDDDCIFQHKLKMHGYTLTRPSMISFKNCTFGPLEITGTLRSLITFDQCLFGDVVNIHDIDYEMGHSSSPDEGSLELYDKYGHEDSKLEHWLQEFPEYSPHQETNINIKRCTFTNSSIVRSTILTNIRCYTPYSTEEEDFEYDTDIITFTENGMNSSIGLSLQCINQHTDYARGYSFKLVEESHRN